MKHRTTVFIPVVTPKDKPTSGHATEGRTEGRLIEVYAESYRFGDDISDFSADETALQQERSAYDRKAIAKYWDRVSAPLRKNSPALYQSGCVAANALRKIRFKHRFFALYQAIKPKAVIESKRLHAVTAWGPTEGHSAELGLALALAASVSGKGSGVIVATGALSSSTPDAGSAPTFRDNDVKVHPVGSLQEKLRLLIREIQEGGFRELIAHRALLVITPRHCSRSGEAQDVKSLPETKTLNALGARVTPVDWLSEALTVMRADTTHYLALDRIIQGATGLITLLVVALGGFSAWRNAEIPMAFVSVNPRNFAAEPFQLCAQADRQFALPIHKISLTPTLPVTSVIGWRTLVGTTDSVDALLASLVGFEGYFIAVIVLSESSPATFDYARIDHTTQALRIAPGRSYEGWIKLNDKAELNALVLLAQRHAPFDTHALRERFQERFRPPAVVSAGRIDHLNVDAAVDFIRTLAPGSLVYPFVSAAGESPCVY